MPIEAMENCRELFCIQSLHGPASTILKVFQQVYYQGKIRYRGEKRLCKIILSRFSPGKKYFFRGREGGGVYYIAIFPVGKSTMEKSVFFPWVVGTARGGCELLSDSYITNSKQ